MDAMEGLATRDILTAIRNATVCTSPHFGRSRFSVALENSKRISLERLISFELIAFDVKGTHTIRVAPFWMLCDFRVWAPSWTG